MQSQLAAVVADFESARERLHRLVDALPAERWARRPAPDRWSVAECVAHLNLTGTVYVPLLRSALEEGEPFREPGPRRYRRDLIGWMLGLATGPLLRVGGFRFGRVRTTPQFMPQGGHSRIREVAEFDRLQAEQITLTRASEGLPLEGLRIISPFNARLHYNVYSCLALLPRHQHRHLDQAEEAARARSALA